MGAVKLPNLKTGAKNLENVVMGRQKTVGGAMGDAGQGLKQVYTKPVSEWKMGGEIGHASETMMGRNPDGGKAPAAEPVEAAPAVPGTLATFNPQENQFNPNTQIKMLMGGMPGIKDADYSSGAQFEDALAGNLTDLQNQARGYTVDSFGQKVPVGSLAENTLKMGTEANIKAALNAAASARGGATAAVQRGAMRTAADMNQMQAAQAAQSRLQEQMQARGLVSSVAQAGMQSAMDKARLKADIEGKNAANEIQVALEQGKINQSEANAQLEAKAAKADMDYKWTIALEELKIKREQNRIARLDAQSKQMSAGIGAIASVIAMGAA